MYILYLFSNYLNVSTVSVKKQSKIVFLKKKRKSHDIMFLKASFKHKLPKHICTKIENFLYFSVIFYGRKVPTVLLTHDEFPLAFSLAKKSPIFSIFSSMPGCQVQFINIG